LAGNDEGDKEKLITKLQIEFATGSAEDISSGNTSWDLGLLYLTNRSVWLVNREKDKTHIDHDSILSIGSLLQREEGSETKFTEVLGADHVIDMVFQPVEDTEGSGDSACAKLSAPRDVLAALRDELLARAGSMMVSDTKMARMSQRTLMRKLTVLLQLNINDEEQLSYLLGVDEKELVNLLIERSQLGVGAQ